MIQKFLVCTNVSLMHNVAEADMYNVAGAEMYNVAEAVQAVEITTIVGSIVIVGALIRWALLHSVLGVKAAHNNQQRRLIR